jgi:hypothetical protein
MNEGDFNPNRERSDKECCWKLSPDKASAQITVAFTERRTSRRDVVFPGIRADTRSLR